MKTKILLLSLIISFFIGQVQAQNRTTINALSNEISDNLDLRAVADIFGESGNLQDFERRLNDPKLQISNLDLNNDNKVDYLRVIETVENSTHVIIIQSVLDRDVYQDVATIEVEKDRYNRIQIQIVGNDYIYGPNYIYEPIYYNTPAIYALFWSYNYRPYVSSWYWNFYPSYYYAWNPYPVYRYRNNINLCLNINNSYNYVNYRRSSRASIVYSSRRSNGYERRYPEYNFTRRNKDIANRYELDQRMITRNIGARNDNHYYTNRSNSNREIVSRRIENNNDYSRSRTNPSREVMDQGTETRRNYSQNGINPSRGSFPQRMETPRNSSENGTNFSRGVITQRTETRRNYSQNRENRSRESYSQRTESSRNYSQNKANSSRESFPQKESRRENSFNRNNRRS